MSLAQSRLNKIESKKIYALECTFQCDLEYTEMFEKMLVIISNHSKYDKGCINYNIFTDDSAPGCYRVYETWNNKKDWEDHLNSEHIVEFIKRSQAIVKDIQIKELREI